MKHYHGVEQSGSTGFQLDRPLLCILIALCLAIVFTSWPDSLPMPETVSTPPSQMLIWDDTNFFIVSNADQPAEQNRVPAQKAPFLFDKININQADSALLQIIPGIGPELARRIIEKRNEQGGFSKPEHLLSVSGIGPKRKEKLTEWLDFE